MKQLMFCGDCDKITKSKKCNFCENTGCSDCDFQSKHKYCRNCDLNLRMEEAIKLFSM